MTVPAPLHPLNLFGSGHDTSEIARIAGISEAEAYNRMAQEREARRRKAMMREARRRHEARNRAELAQLRAAAAMPPLEARR